MSLGVGARLGHYEVTAKIGEGGSGEVWQATDTKLGRQIVLKNRRLQRVRWLISPGAAIITDVPDFTVVKHDRRGYTTELNYRRAQVERQRASATLTAEPLLV